VSCVQHNIPLSLAVPKTPTTVPFFLLLRKRYYASFPLVGNLSFQKDFGLAAMTDKEISLSNSLIPGTTCYDCPPTVHGVACG